MFTLGPLVHRVIEGTERVYAGEEKTHKHLTGPHVKETFDGSVWPQETTLGAINGNSKRSKFVKVRAGQRSSMAFVPGACGFTVIGGPEQETK